MARGRPRWERRDLRHRFPLPSERQAEPRFDGDYGDDATGRVRFAADGSLRWNGEPGTWRVHAHVLDVSAPGVDCEGAIGSDAVYLLCTDAELGERTQMVLGFAPAA
jgi:hypothetical protein